MSKAPLESVNASHRLANVRILIVESDQRMLSLFRSILVTIGIPGSNIVSAATANQAWKALTSRAPDLIVCDWWRMELDGLMLTERIRKSGESFRDVPILMVTGHAESADVQAARDAGISEFLVKPFTVQALCQKIKEIVEKPRIFVVAPAFVGPDRRRKKAASSKERRTRKTPPLPKT